MIKEILGSLVILFILEVVLVIIPLLLNVNILVYVFFILNALISWYLLKRVEKLYYKRYEKLFSMLYMSCPLIGICLLFGIMYYITKEEAILYLLKYYIPLYILIMIINLIYIIIKYIVKK